MRMHRITLLLGCALLAACGGDKPAATDAQGEDVLPKPAVAGQSVTGMPDPGLAGARPAPVEAAAVETEATELVELPEDSDAGAAMPIDGTASGVPVGAPPPPVAEPPAPPQPVAPVAPPANDTGATPAVDTQR